MNVLVTGGAGFIGSHIAELLLDKDHHVHIIDDLSTGSIRNIDKCRENSRFSYSIDTIMNQPLMAELVDRAERIYHLAAAVGVRLIVEKPVQTIETNIRGTEVVLELAGRKNKKILVTSSSEVYGKSSKVPFSETDDLVLGSTMRPRWSYACSKAIDEFLALAYHREQKLKAVVVRLFNTVGPRQTGQYGMVLPRFVQQALEGRPVTVYGDGTQTRSFAHVLDVAEAVIALMDEPRAEGEVFNVGNDHEVSVKELAELIIRRTSSESRIDYVPFQEAYDENFEDLARRVPDLTKLRSAIGYAPKRDIDQIIDEVAQFQRVKVS